MCLNPLINVGEIASPMLEGGMNRARLAVRAPRSAIFWAGEGSTGTKRSSLCYWACYIRVLFTAFDRSCVGPGLEVSLEVARVVGTELRPAVATVYLPSVDDVGSFIDCSPPLGRRRPHPREAGADVPEPRCRPRGGLERASFLLPPSFERSITFPSSSGDEDTSSVRSGTAGRGAAATESPLPATLRPRRRALSPK